MDLLLSFQAFFLINLVSEFIIFHHYILQVWSNDVLMKSMQTHNDSILSIWRVNGCLQEAGTKLSVCRCSICLFNYIDYVNSCMAWRRTSWFMADINLFKKLYCSTYLHLEVPFNCDFNFKLIISCFCLNSFELNLRYIPFI